MRRRGFGLLEVLMAMFLVVTVLYAIESILPSSLSMMRKSTTTVVANDLARLYLETWKQKSFSALTGTHTYPDTVDGVQYSTVVTVGDVTPVDPNVKQIDVQVQWNAGGMAGASRVEYLSAVYNAVNPW